MRRTPVRLRIIVASLFALVVLAGKHGDGTEPPERKEQVLRNDDF